MAGLSSTAASVAAAAGDPDEFYDLLLELAPEVDSFLASYPPAEGAPEDPHVDASPYHRQAWQDAYSLQTWAGQATPLDVKHLAGNIRRKRRRDKQRVTRDESMKLAQSLVDHARTLPLVEMTTSLLDLRKKQ